MSVLAISTRSVANCYSECKEFHYTFSMTFGKWLYEARKNARLTQSQLASRVPRMILFTTFLCG